MRENGQDLPISDTEITMACSSTMSLTMESNKTDFAVQVNPPTNTETTQTEKHIGLDLEVRIENSVLKNRFTSV